MKNSSSLGIAITLLIQSVTGGYMLEKDNVWHK